MSSADWTALAVGGVLGLLAYAAAFAAKRWLRKAIDARVCPLCGCGCQAPPERPFTDGVRQLCDQLDQQKEQQ